MDCGPPYVLRAGHRSTCRTETSDTFGVAIRSFDGETFGSNLATVAVFGGTEWCKIGGLASGGRRSFLGEKGVLRSRFSTAFTDVPEIGLRFDTMELWRLVHLDEWD